MHSRKHENIPALAFIGELAQFTSKLQSTGTAFMQKEKPPFNPNVTRSKSFSFSLLFHLKLNELDLH